MVGTALSTGSARTNKVPSSGKLQDEHQEPIRAEGSSSSWFWRDGDRGALRPAMEDSERLNGRTVGKVGGGESRRDTPTGSERVSFALHRRRFRELRFRPRREEGGRGGARRPGATCRTPPGVSIPGVTRYVSELAVAVAVGGFERTSMLGGETLQSVHVHRMYNASLEYNTH